MPDTARYRPWWIHQANYFQSLVSRLLYNISLICSLDGKAFSTNEWRSRSASSRFESLLLDHLSTSALHQRNGCGTTDHARSQSPAPRASQAAKQSRLFRAMTNLGNDSLSANSKPASARAVSH